MKASNPLTPFLDQQGLLIIDGGLATELENRGHNLNDDLWSARLLLDDPQAIRQVHLDYLTAGADCIISATYQATIEGFMRRGLSASEASSLIAGAVELAVDVRDTFWSDPKNRPSRLMPIVAASIGPYGAALADGSEYRGDYDLDQAALEVFHRPRWQLLVGSGADIVAFETIPSLPEAKAIANLIAENSDTWTWVSFSCRDEKHVSDGSLFVDCIAELAQLEQVAALGINCTPPRYIPALIQQTKSVSQKPIIVYPNSGESYDAVYKVWSGTSEPDDFAAASVDWRDSGACLIGGCCRTTPRHISEIRHKLLT